MKSAAEIAGPERMEDLRQQAEDQLEDPLAKIRKRAGIDTSGKTDPSPDGRPVTDECTPGPEEVTPSEPEGGKPQKPEGMLSTRDIVKAASAAQAGIVDPRDQKVIDRRDKLVGDMQMATLNLKGAEDEIARLQGTLEPLKLKQAEARRAAIELDHLLPNSLRTVTKETQAKPDDADSPPADTPPGDGVTSE